MSVISNIILGGITGAIINALSMIRNILCYKDKLGLKEKIVITILTIILTLNLIIYGYDSIPTSWIDKLMRKDYLIGLASDFEKEVMNYEV